MYIKKIYIENYGKFRKSEIELNKMSIFIARNDAGKTTIFKLISSLFNTRYESNSKYLNSITTSNINCNTIDDYKKEVENEGYTFEDIVDKFPKILIQVEFEYEDASDRSILRKFECEGKFVLHVEYKLKKSYTEIKQEFNLSTLTSEQFIEFLIDDDYFKISYIDLNGATIKYEYVNSIGIRYLTTSRGMRNGKIQFQAMEESFESTKLEKYEISSKYNRLLGELADEYGRSNVFGADSLKIPVAMNDIRIVPEQMDGTFYFNRYIPLLNGLNINQNGDGFRSLFEMLLYIKLLVESDKRFSVLLLEEPELHLCHDNLHIIKQNLAGVMSENKYQTLITTHSNHIIDKLNFSNVIVETAAGFQPMSKLLGKDELLYLSLNPNMDLYTFLIATNVILVEGITEEIYIKALLKYRMPELNINVISFHKGYTDILKIWKKLFSGTDKRIVCIRDYDNQPLAQVRHENLNTNNIKSVTTSEYTFEPEFLKTGDNRSALKVLNEAYENNQIINDFIDNKNPSKSEFAYRLAELISIDEENSLEIPDYLLQCFEFIRGDND